MPHQPHGWTKSWSTQNASRQSVFKHRVTTPWPPQRAHLPSGSLGKRRRADAPDAMDGVARPPRTPWTVWRERPGRRGRQPLPLIEYGYGHRHGKMMVVVVTMTMRMAMLMMTVIMMTLQLQPTTMMVFLDDRADPADATNVGVRKR